MANDENKVLIITGGQIDEAFLQECVTNEAYSMIITADHGLLMADRLKLPLDFIVGDFDSVPERILEQYRKISTPIKKFPTEKDKTDTEIAIELALLHNATSIDIIGATGSRLDHVLANIHLLMLPMQLNVKAHILDPNNKIYLKKEDFKVNKNEQYGNFLSLMPLSGNVTGLSMIGFKYPLKSITLSPGSSLCISNEIVDEEAIVEFTEGILIVFETKD